jgi:hypothetical protein
MNALASCNGLRGAVPRTPPTGRRGTPPLASEPGAPFRRVDGRCGNSDTALERPNSSPDIKPEQIWSVRIRSEN